MKFFCFKQISKYDTCFYILKGFLEIQFLDLKLQSQKSYGLFYIFFHRPNFFQPCTLPCKDKTLQKGAPDAPPPACLRLMQGHLNCYQFFRTFRTFARRPLSRRTRIWSSIQQRILFSIYIWINVIHERYLFI